MPSLIDFGIYLPARWAWMPGPAVFVAMLLVPFAARRVVFEYVRRRTASRHELLDCLLEALSRAISIVIVVVAMAVAISFEPLPPRWLKIVNAILTAGAILAVIVFIDGLLTFWMRREAARFPVLGESYGLVTGFIRSLVFSLGVLMFLDSMGISVGPILATLGIGSLALALALQETLKNTLSGFFVIIDKPLQVGDYIKLSSGQEGWLTQLGWRSSKFRMMNENTVVVPNSQLIDSILTNLRAPGGAQSVEIDLNVAAGSDLEQVERVTKEVAAEALQSVSNGNGKFTPAVYFQTIGSGTIGVAVLLRIARSAEIEQAKHEFIKRITSRYRAENIKLA